MVKKVVLGIVLFGLIGILAAGAIIRTVDKTAQVAEAQGLQQGRGHGYNAGLEDQNHDCDQGVADGQGEGFAQGRSGGQGHGNSPSANTGRWATETQGAARRGQGGRGQGQGQANAPSDERGVGQAEVDAWLTVSGTVTSVDTSALIVGTTEGQEIVVESRPWSFAQELGFWAEVGDQVELTGFYEDAEFKVGAIHNLSSGQMVTVREESGRPLWAGRGRRGS